MENGKENIKYKYHHCQNVLVEKVSVELDEKTQDVKRLRFKTDVGDITFKPKIDVKLSKEKSGIMIESKDTQMYKLDQFIKEFPIVPMIAMETKKKGQVVTLSYTEMVKHDDNADDDVSYKYMSVGQFTRMYYEKFHRDNKENLTVMQQIRDKFLNKDIDLSEAI